MKILKQIPLHSLWLLCLLFFCSASLPVAENLSNSNPNLTATTTFDPPPVEKQKVKKHKKKKLRSKRKIKKEKRQNSSIAISIVALAMGVLSAVGLVLLFTVLGTSLGGITGVLIAAGVVTLFSLTALVTGIIAVSSIKKGQEGRLGLALPGMVLGIVVLSIMVIFWLIYLLILAIAGMI